MVVQSDITHSTSLRFTELQHSPCKSSAAFPCATLSPARPTCGCRPLKPTSSRLLNFLNSRSVFPRPRKSLLPLRKKNLLNICVSHNSADHKGLMGPLSLNLASGMCPSDQQILAARDLRIHQSGTQFLQSRFFLFSFFRVPSVTFLSSPAPFSCTLSSGLKCQMASCYRTKPLSMRVRTLTPSVRALELCGIFNPCKLPAVQEHTS